MVIYREPHDVSEAFIVCGRCVPSFVGSSNSLYITLLCKTDNKQHCYFSTTGRETHNLDYLLKYDLLAIKEGVITVTTLHPNSFKIGLFSREQKDS